MQQKKAEAKKLLCQTPVCLDVPYAKVTEEEKQTMLNVLRKSKTLQSGIPKRGKYKRKG